VLPKIVEPQTLPRRELTVKEIAAAKKAGYLEIHDNGVLTIKRPGQPEFEVQPTKTDRKPDRRRKLNGHTDHSAARLYLNGSRAATDNPPRGRGV
jgi:hypothetical protein